LSVEAFVCENAEPKRNNVVRINTIFFISNFLIKLIKNYKDENVILILGFL
jgi:hypothetical protein